MIDEALAIMDHVATRVTAATATGLSCGAAYATLKGFPVFKTSVSAAMSCAMISTACFGMERVAHGVLRQCMSTTTALTNNDDDGSYMPPPENLLLYGSHAFGGMFGGSVVGFLFQGKPFAGALLMMPLMLGIGKMDISLNEYRTERLQQLLEEDEAKRMRK